MSKLGLEEICAEAAFISLNQILNSYNLGKPIIGVSALTPYLISTSILCVCVCVFIMDWLASKR